MAMQPIHLRTRRRLAIAVTTLAILILSYLVQRQAMQLEHAAFLSGSATFVCLFLLLLIGVRRRISFLPLGNMSMWTQIHIHVGIFASAAYLHHVPRVIGNGFFESLLSCLFLFVAGSGIYGMYISRTLPRRLANVGGEYRFDRIAWTRRQIAEMATQLVQVGQSNAATPVLNKFYESTLAPFFQSQPRLAYIVVPNGQYRRRILADLKELDRYFEQETRQTAGKLASLVRKRDDLDYHFALQLRLRCWVLMHSLFSILLLACSIVHVAIVLRFFGN